MRTLIFLLWFTLGFYCMLDAYQTKLLFDHGFAEANPIIKYLIDITGVWWSMVIIKAALVISLGITLLYVGNQLRLSGKD